MGNVESRDLKIAKEIKDQMEKDKFALTIFNIIQKYNKLEAEGKVEEAKATLETNIEEAIEKLNRWEVAKAKELTRRQQQYVQNLIDY